MRALLYGLIPIWVFPLQQHRFRRDGCVSAAHDDPKDRTLLSLSVQGKLIKMDTLNVRLLLQYDKSNKKKTVVLPNITLVRDPTRAVMRSLLLS